MDLKEIKQVVELMKDFDLLEFEIEEKDLKLRLCREGKAVPVVAQPAPQVAPAIPAAPLPAASAGSAPAPAAAEDASIKLIKSPMVGTFYRAPSPESPPFVDIQSKVNPDTVVCIIEAMKVMNEIHAEIKGVIVDVLVENGQAVEYGQPLFKVKVS